MSSMASLIQPHKDDLIIVVEFIFEVIIDATVRYIYIYHIVIYISWILGFRIKNASVLINLCLDNALCTVKRKCGHYIKVQQKIISFTSK